MSSLYKAALLILAMGAIWAIHDRLGPGLPLSQGPSFESSLLTETLQRSKAKDQPQTTETAFKLNVNTATVQELEPLPGIGPKLAEAIICFRDDHGDFKTLDQLKEVKGIGEKQLAVLSKLLTVSEQPSGATGGDE